MKPKFKHSTFIVKSVVLICVLAFLTMCSEDQGGDIPFEATVSGTITDANSGEPLPGVSVALSQGDGTSQSTSTNEEGNYSISVPVLGEEVFSITATLNGYEVFIFAEFTLTAGNQTKEADISLQPKAKIIGHVTHEETSAGLRDVSISISDGESIASNEFGFYEFDDLEAGTYELSFSKSGFESGSSTIEVTAGEEKTNEVSLTPIPAVLEVDKISLDFGTTETVLPIELSNIGGDTVTWSIVENISWASANPLSGKITTDPVTLNLSVNREGFDPGDYAQTLTIASDAGTKTISLTMTIQGAILQIIPSELSFGTTSTEESLTFTRLGQGTIDYEILVTKSWLTVAGSNTGSITNGTSVAIINVDRTGLGFGNYQGQLIFNGGNEGQTVNVFMTVADPNAPQLTIEPLSINLGQDVATRLISVQNTGKGAVNWTVSKSTSWLSVSETEGQVLESQTQNISITADRSTLTPGGYTDELRFTSSEGGNVTVPVTLEVANKPVLSVSKDQLDLGRELTASFFMVSNIGNGDMTWSASTDQDWITINPTSGVNSGTINVTISREGLSDGNYSGQVDIESDGGVVSVLLLMKVFPPNEPPVADFTLSREVADLNQEINLDATGSTDDFDISSLLEVRWRYIASGSFTEWRTVKQSSISYTTQGIKGITLEVRDLDGAIGSTTKEVTVVENQAPNAVFSVNPASGKVGETTFMVDAVGSNDDKDDFDDLQFRWRWEAGQNFTNWSREKTANHVYGTIGTKTITVEVLDTDDAVGTTDLSVEVTQDLTELEPNDVFTAANEVVLGSPTIGNIGLDGDDEDWYKIIIPSNGILDIFLNNTSAGTNSNLNFLNIYDENLTLIQEFATDRVNNCCSNNAIAPNSTARSSNNVVSKGTILYVLVRPLNDDNIGDYQLDTVFEPFTTPDLSEPNNVKSEALNIPIGTSINATIGFDGDDEDWYQLVPETNGTLQVTFENLHIENFRYGSISLLRLYDDNLNLLQVFGPDRIENCCSVTGFLPGSIMNSSRITVTGGERYFVKVDQFSSNHAAPYRLQSNLKVINTLDFGEGNDTRALATMVESDIPISAIVGFGNDEKDWYQFNPSNNGTLRISLENLQNAGTLYGAISLVKLYNNDLVLLRSFGSDRINNCCSTTGFNPTGIANSGSVTVSNGVDYFIEVAEFSSTHAANYILESVLTLASVEDFGESNDVKSEAYVTSLGESVIATIGYESDREDWYEVTPSADGSIKVTFENLQETGVIHGDIALVQVFDNELNQLVSFGADRIDNCCSNTGFRPQSTAISTSIDVQAMVSYFIKVRPFSSIDAANYRLEVNQE